MFLTWSEQGKHSIHATWSSSKLILYYLVAQKCSWEVEELVTHFKACSAIFFSIWQRWNNYFGFFLKVFLVCWYNDSVTGLLKRYKWSHLTGLNTRFKWLFFKLLLFHPYLLHNEHLFKMVSPEVEFRSNIIDWAVLLSLLPASLLSTTKLSDMDVTAKKL